MKLHVITWIVLGYVLSGPAAGVGTAAARAGLNPEAAIDTTQQIDGRLIMGLLSEGRPDSALTLLDAYERDHKPGAFELVLRARVMREMMGDEDDGKDLISADADRIHAVLDHAISLCDNALDRSVSDPSYYYYRGRAWIGKTQLYVLVRGYWSAGRCAGKAKRDLEKFLEFEPNNPDAQGDLGAFLYFADTLPGLMKFLGKLLFIPSGDRERGLKMLHYAASHDGIFRTDYRIALAAIDLVFEGWFEQGIPAMEQLLEEFPNYTRLAEPMNIVAPLYPLRIRELQRVDEMAVDRHLSRGSSLADWALIKRMQLHEAYVTMFFDSPRVAFNRFATIVENPPARPDWVLPLAIINRGILYAKQGESDKARTAFQTVLASSVEGMEHFHNLSRSLVEGLQYPSATMRLADLDFIGAIYDFRLDEAQRGLDQYGAAHGKDVLYYFYLGDLNIYRQRFVDAAKAYQQCLDLEAFGGDQSYQMFAALRMAEIHGAEGRYGVAKDYVEKAFKYNHAGYLLDFIISARERFYELLDKGTLTSPPTMLLLAAPASGGAHTADN